MTNPLYESFLTIDSISNIRRHLAAAIPTSDQILLLGPPYKVPKDSTFQSDDVLNSLHLGDLEDTNAEGVLSTTEGSGARRLFLFSKRALSEQAPDTPTCHLEPMTLRLPIEPGQCPLHFGEPSSSPLHLALQVYERRFMLNLDGGRVLADGADLRLSACQTCVSEQAIMARALRAAVSNLSVHFNGTLRLRSEFTAEFQAQMSTHGSLLTRFESILASLANMPLHMSLISIARASGRVMETLLDTVPVERERSWASQCRTSHQRLLAMFADLDVSFSVMGTTASREEAAKLDLQCEYAIKTLWREIETTGQQSRDRQAQRLDKLTSYHSQVVKVVMDTIAGVGTQDAFATLESMSKSSQDILPAMIADDEEFARLMQKVAVAKTEAMKRMKARLREVSVSQSAIQRVTSSVTVLREALSQHSENMGHLEHVAELPESYRDFLSELRRRRAYGAAVTSSSTAMMDRLATMRGDEVKAREKFLRGSGRHLMPPFFEIFAPTLATPPPLFTPQLPAMVEMDTLPEISHSEIVGCSSSDAHMQGGGVSSASSLTAASQPLADDIMTPDNLNIREQLIVSADDQIGEDLIIEPSGGAAADAERKTLAYENAVLRQTLEKIGQKIPRIYIEGKDENDQREKELANLRKELEETKQRESIVHEMLTKQTASKLSDKISHSSFVLGDVVLFMPTGPDKHTYMAFHTNCPYRYLSTENISGTPDYVLGRIVFQEKLVAGALGSETNPFGLNVGTKFWIITVEVLTQK